MIIQREIENVMLAIDELVQARVDIFDASIGLIGRNPLSAKSSLEKYRERANKARIAICDSLKEVIRSAGGEK